MYRFIVIWESIPERTQIFMLSTEDESIKSKLFKCHGHFINLIKSQHLLETLTWLDGYLQDMKPIYDTNDKDNKVIETSGCIIHTGMVL